ENAVDEASVEHGNDQLGLEDRGEPRLSSEAVPECHGLDAIGARNLERHRAAEVTVGCTINNAERPAPKFAVDPEPAECLAWTKVAPGESRGQEALPRQKGSKIARKRCAVLWLLGGSEHGFEQSVHCVIRAVPIRLR